MGGGPSSLPKVEAPEVAAEQKATLRTPPNAVVIGLTGGIASGKSTVCQVLEQQGGAIVLNADHFGHEAYKPGTACQAELVAHFGEQIINKEDGTVDRKTLGGLVFADPKEREALNAIVWPAIRDLLRQRVFEITNENPADRTAKLIVIEAAILIEANWMDLIDELWVVTTNVDTAKTRLMARNSMSEEDAMKRINSQISNEERRAVAHVDVPNEGDESALKDAVVAELEKLHARYSRLSAFEMVDVVDKEDQVQTTAKRAVVRAFNLISRCSYVVLVQQTSGKIFVQRRSDLKDSGPGLLDPAPGGVLGAGESYLLNAQREMAEEMGLPGLSLEHVSALWYEDGNERSWGTIFCAKVDADVSSLTLQPSEVSSVELMSPEEILTADPSQFLPGGLAAFKLWSSKQQ
ncbi:Dephospho-CoA kinase, putative [Hondaea fermentalgiana]|uniref:Dephospho-CoA kinase, putative n=1 Tax=Hondaea fermentalgiana TaxID=2315210 RepID=A0A2R5GFS4_9STRA|nr:Dephospho-CoA kinase, putative [Hondaea fermentalgiana]|eukprot:GBG29766.1 Dephospho-CoA kinase, putative [Hondaea fermentalgiana]